MALAAAMTRLDERGNLRLKDGSSAVVSVVVSLQEIHM
jgi:hypothetical protein